MDRARARVQSFDEQDIAWQIEVVLQNTNSLPSDAGAPVPALQQKPLLRSEADVTPKKEIFIAESDKITSELTGYAIRRGPSAAWIGFDWLGDAEVSQLAPLGLELHNGVSGIAVFLAGIRR